MNSQTPYQELRESELEKAIENKGQKYLYAYRCLRTFVILFRAAEGAVSGSALFMLFGYIIGEFEVPIAVPKTNTNLIIYNMLWGSLSLAYAGKALTKKLPLSEFKAGGATNIRLKTVAEEVKEVQNALAESKENTEEKLQEASYELSQTHIDTTIKKYINAHWIIKTIGEILEPIHKVAKGVIGIGVLDIFVINMGDLKFHAFLPNEVVAVCIGATCRLGHYFSRKAALKTLPLLENKQLKPREDLQPKKEDFSKTKLSMAFILRAMSYIGIATWWADFFIQGFEEINNTNINPNIAVPGVIVGAFLTSTLVATSSLYNEWLKQVRYIVSRKEYLNLTKQPEKVFDASEQSRIIPQDKSILKKLETLWSFAVKVVICSWVSTKGADDLAGHVHKKIFPSEQPERALSPWAVLGIILSFLVINSLVFMMDLTRDRRQEKLDKQIQDYYTQATTIHAQTQIKSPNTIQDIEAQA